MREQRLQSLSIDRFGGVTDGELVDPALQYGTRLLGGLSALAGSVLGLHQYGASAGLGIGSSLAIRVFLLVLGLGVCNRISQCGFHLRY